jgi:hypothetical protein
MVQSWRRTKVLTEMSALRRVSLVIVAIVSAAFLAYSVELLIRTKYGSHYESIGADVIFMTLVFGLVANMAPLVILWKTRFRKLAVSAFVFTLPPLIWFVWAINVGVIGDKSRCIDSFGYLTCISGGWLGH